MSKFSGPYASELDEIVGDGCAETIGGVDELGHYAKFDGEVMSDGTTIYAILYTNSDGFVDATLYDTTEELAGVWDTIEAMYEGYDRGNDEGYDLDAEMS